MGGILWKVVQYADKLKHKNHLINKSFDGEIKQKLCS